VFFLANVRGGGQHGPLEVLAAFALLNGTVFSEQTTTAMVVEIGAPRRSAFGIRAALEEWDQPDFLVLRHICLHAKSEYLASIGPSVRHLWNISADRPRT